MAWLYLHHPLHNKRAAFLKMNYLFRVGIRVRIQDKDYKTCGCILTNSRASRGLRSSLRRQGCEFSLAPVGDI